MKACDLIKQLLIFSRKVESKLRPINLNHEIMQVSKMLERTIPKMIRIEFYLLEDLEIINADPIQIEQILMNLCINARDAMPSGGALTIETRDLVLSDAYCETHVDIKPGRHVQIAVSDTGCGMDAHHKGTKGTKKKIL